MLLNDVPTPPAIITPFRRGVCFHVDKPCFKLEQKPQKNREVPFRKDYYINRMKTAAKNVQSPDMNMTLNEIKTGVKTSERARLSLEVYLLGVLVIFGFVNKD